MPKNGAASPVSTRTKLLIYLSALNAGILLISNLSATKIWSLFGIPVDGGVIIFPLSYILGDVIVEFYGRKTSKHVVWASFILSTLATITFWIVGALPALDEGTNAAFNTILGSVPRIVAGSLIAYVAAQLLNNYVFEKIKQKTGSKWLVVRSLGSSFAAHVVDTLLFDTIAFAGTMPFGDFINLTVFAFVLAVSFEAILQPLTYVAVAAVRKFLHMPTLKEAIKSEQK